MRTDVLLKDYTTMRLGGPARFFGEVASIADIDKACQAAQQHNLPVFVLGSGSNTLAHDDGFNGVVLHNQLKGFEILEQTPEYTIIKVAGGENWDETVEKTVGMGLSGIEALSGIPGTVGAAPVQNIGAYGQEVSNVIVSVDVYEIATGEQTVLASGVCEFGYRSSIFRTTAMNRYFITAVTMKLSSAKPQPPFYAPVADYLQQQEVTDYSVGVIREAVLSIRQYKLPDPTVVANAGSFFKNAIVEDWKCKELTLDYPNMPYYPMPGGSCKIPTGWLIDTMGFKGRVSHGIRVHDKNALVLINESATSYSDLAAARGEIIGAVRDKYGIAIEQEPLELQA